MAEDLVRLTEKLILSSDKIVLTSCDGVSFEMDEAVARKSKTIAEMLEVGCQGAIPVENVTGEILDKVLHFCKKHAEAGQIEEEEDDGEAKKELEIWDSEFFKLDLETIFELILAANYLNIPELLDVASQTVADCIKDKSVEEVRDIFRIENDYTEEEEEAVRKENEWAFD